ncbi:MAG: Na+/H+ antiporter NhaC family protein [Selenomonadaceae bacterium]|nr:Na+/H+ antiporter NhaC family protein [Selenomonadaceae bacterium]
MAQTAWVMLLPIITIVLALITKEVYMSLLIGIFAGAFLYAEFNFFEAVIAMFKVMAEKVGENANLLIFLIILGILVAVIARSGATRAYSDWAYRRIHSERGALLVTPILGVIIFIDDYFNCLTVGTVMRPVTDRFKIARAKLAYVIDATAAPVCIIAPVSSWAAAIASSLPKDSALDGFALFIQTIPYNIYAWLTLVFLFYIIISGRDFGFMAKKVREAKENFTVPQEYNDAEYEALVGKDGRGKLLDLILPILILIIGCVYGMLYTGGFEDGKTVAEAFAECDSSQGMVFGAYLALVFTALLYLPRRVLSFKAFCASFSLGFKLMTPAIFILCLNWTFSGLCSEDYLDLGGFVGKVVQVDGSLTAVMPAAFFLIALGLSFTTGNSWGAFGILIPIAVTLLGINDMEILVMTVAAILSGAVGGDHASPIADTTILSSAGAQCDHIEHVNTQLPYVIIVSTASFCGYLVGGLAGSGWLGLLTGLLALSVAMTTLYFRTHRNSL